MKRIITQLGTVLAAALAVSSCALLGFGQADEVDAAFAAGGVLDYVASSGYDQVQELEVAADTYDLLVAGSGGSQSARAITTETVVREYPNVTFTVTRELDDGDTPDDPTDDVLTVTRVADYGFEANAVQVLVRPLRPTADPAWDSFDPGTGPEGWNVDPFDVIVQDGTVENSLDSVTISNGTIQATWRLAGANVYAEEIVREMTSVVRPNLVRRTIIEQAADGTTTLTREREVDGVVVHTYTVEPFEDPETGDVFVRITREDGSYAVVRERGNRLGDPRVVDSYSADDVLVMTVEEVRSGPRGEMTSTRTFYDGNGAVIGTRVVTYSVSYLDGSDEDAVRITRSVNGRTRTVEITESGDVYLVTVRGTTYRVRSVNATTVEFLDDAGNAYMTAERAADGGWIITTADGQTVV